MITGSINSNVAQRTSYYGMLRCLGAGKNQVRMLVTSHVFGVAISRPTLVKNGAPSYLDDPRYCTEIGRASCRERV